MDEIKQTGNVSKGPIKAADGGWRLDFPLSPRIWKSLFLRWVQRATYDSTFSVDYIVNTAKDIGCHPDCWTTDSGEDRVVAAVGQTMVKPQPTELTAKGYQDAICPCCVCQRFHALNQLPKADSGADYLSFFAQQDNKRKRNTTKLGITGPPALCLAHYKGNHPNMPGTAEGLRKSLRELKVPESRIRGRRKKALQKTWNDEISKRVKRCKELEKECSQRVKAWTKIRETIKRFQQPEEQFEDPA